MLYRYKAWDGTQEVEALTAEDLMDALAEDLMNDGDLRSALERLLQQGDQGRLDNRLQGLRDMLERLRQARNEQLQQHNLNSIMDDIKKRLEEIVDMERQGIDRRLEQAGMQPPRQQQAPSDAQQSNPDGDESQQGQQQAGRQSNSQTGQQHSGQGEQQDGPERQLGATGQGSQGQQGTADSDRQRLERMLRNLTDQKRDFLNELPDDTGGKIRKLNDYEFMSAEAREKFQELLAMLQQQVANQYFQGMQQAIQGMTPEDIQAMRDMVRDLNKLLEAKAQGKEPNFDEFMQKHGQYFPGVNSLDELLQQLSQRMSQMQSLMNSLSGQQRNDLQSMLDSLFRDDRLRWDLAQLGQLLNQLMPRQGQRGRYPFSGDEPMSLQEAMQMMQQLQEMDELERQLRQAGQGRMDRLDPSLAERVLGPEAREQLEQLQGLTQLLEEAGYIKRKGAGWELTARGIRRIGQNALREIFADLKKDRIGQHEMDRQGSAGERVDDSKTYEFGDPFLLDLRETLSNAITRQGPGTPVKLQASDFEVFRTEQLTQVSTVLMIDLSRSMLLRDCFTAAKRVVLALNSLIRTQYPRDTLYIVGFSDRAREMKPEELSEIDWSEYVYGTNLQHGLWLAKRLLSRHKAGTRQVIVITDGEPTAHIEDDGNVFFHYPTTYRTYAATIKEVVRCTRDQIVINTFMLDNTPYLAQFINEMTKINKGRAFFADPGRLGEYILVDYLRNKRKRVG